MNTMYLIRGRKGLLFRISSKIVYGCSLFVLCLMLGEEEIFYLFQKCADEPRSWLFFFFFFKVWIFLSLGKTKLLSIEFRLYKHALMHSIQLNICMYAIHAYVWIHVCIIICACTCIFACMCYVHRVWGYMREVGIGKRVSKVYKYSKVVCEMKYL